MAKNLVIVESPAKAKTIAQYLGSDFNVKSSFGHVRDLPKTGMSIDIEHGFKPEYAISSDKAKIVSELKKAVKTAEIVWLATDEDREGEAIAWHLAEALKLSPERTRRIAFHEITKPAITAAVEHPRQIDQNLVDAQQARRVLDRLVGYELSPILWRKIQRGLSAGRVQSVAVRLIVEREREIDAFTPESLFKVTAVLSSESKEFSGELNQKFKAEPETKNWLESVIPAKFIVDKLETKPATKSPPPPFITSTLQQAAAAALGMSIKQTMVIAQQLYEAGQITYMRTDSLSMSELALKQAAQVIEKRFGKAYSNIRRYQTKRTDAQEAHEAIRPTNFDTDALSDPAKNRLYQLIWRRALASQMAAAQTQKTRAEIAISTVPARLIASGEVIKFAGFLTVAGGQLVKKGEQAVLPPLQMGQTLDLKNLLAAQIFSRAKPRYTEGTLVKKLEEIGIGRPSTYAPIISTIQARQYVEKGEREGESRDHILLSLAGGKIERQVESQTVGADKGRLFPTEIGKVVNDFLVKYFLEVVDYDFTANVETEFDDIAEGKKVWNQMIAKFYGPFHKTVEAGLNVSRQEASQIREIGLDPASGKPVLARIGRFGPMVQLGVAEDEDKPKFAPLPAGTTMENVTLDQALTVLSLPRIVGNTAEGEEITANFGRFGPYVKVGSKYVSIKPDDPFSITLPVALDLIKAKREGDAKMIIKEFPNSPIRVLDGRYGPYINDGKKNARIPKGTAPEKLTLQQAADLLKNSPSKPRRRFVKKT